MREAKSAVDAYSRAVRFVVRILTLISAATLICVMLVIILAVILRRATNLDLPFTIEYSGYLLIGIIFLGLASAFESGSHIRVEVVLSRLRNPKARQYANLWTCILALIYMSFLLSYSVEMSISAYQLEELSSFPVYTILNHEFQTLVWIPQLVIPLGVTVFILALIAEILKILFGLGTVRKE